MILILTDDFEGISYVTQWLDEWSESYTTITVRRCVDEKLLLALDGPPITGRGLLRIGNRIISLDSIKSVWYRRPKPIIAKTHKDIGMSSFVCNQFQHTLWSLMTVLPGFWMNHPFVGYRLLEENKLLQLQIASEVGFKVPQTIIGNDPDAILKFTATTQGPFAVKLVAGAFYEGSNGELMTSYTKSLSHSELSLMSRDIPLAPVIV